MIEKEFKGEADVDKYQKRLNELYKGRKEIVLGIKELTQRQRFMNSRDHAPTKTQPHLNKEPSV